ncbi:MAG: hypothetical protein QM831_14170 [Kofleriaceae bacterium]
MKVVIGVAIVVIHLIAFAIVAAHSAGDPFEVNLATGKATVARAVETKDGTGPGLRRTHWTASYRGGFVREVAATALTGPFQTAGTCSGRIVVGQALVDRVAAVVKQQVADQMRGTEIFGLGSFVAVRDFAMAWAQPEIHPFERGLLGDKGAPNGYLRVTSTIAFDRANIPLTLAAVPEVADGKLAFRIEAYAQVQVDNRFVQWLNSKVDVTSKLATRIVNHELDAMLVTALAPPPPFPLDKDQTLAFGFCPDPIEIREKQYGALPFAVMIGKGAQPLPAMPVTYRGPVVLNGDVAIDLDVNALNGLLYELWRTGWLDKRLADVGLDRRFNADPTVTEFLTVRLSPLTLALPPIIEPAGDHLKLAADARVTLHDGADVIGRVFGSVDFRFPLAVHVGPLELACEKSSTVLVPCYADLVGALADRGADFDGALTTSFGKLLTDIFENRELATGDLPATLTLTSVTPSLLSGARGVHLDLGAKLSE